MHVHVFRLLYSLYLTYKIIQLTYITKIYIYVARIFDLWEIFVKRKVLQFQTSRFPHEFAIISLSMNNIIWWYIDKTEDKTKIDIIL